jgi:hypothetical protein
VNELRGGMIAFGTPRGAKASYRVDIQTLQKSTAVLLAAAQPFLENVLLFWIVEEESFRAVAPTSLTVGTSGFTSPIFLQTNESQRSGGGAGIRTRVRKYILARIYDAYLLLMSRSQRREAAKNRWEPAPGSLIASVRNHAPATSLLI